MNQATTKDMRKQLRNVVKELLPEILTAEFRAEILMKLYKELKARLDEIDQRQKDIQSYVVRNSMIKYDPVKKD